MRAFTFCASFLMLATVTAGYQTPADDYTAPEFPGPNPLGINISDTLPNVTQPYTYTEIEKWIANHLDSPLLQKAKAEDFRMDMPNDFAMNLVKQVLQLPVTCFVEDMVQNTTKCPASKEYHYMQTLVEAGGLYAAGGQDMTQFRSHDGTPQLFEPFKWFIKVRDANNTVRSTDFWNVRINGWSTAWLLAVTNHIPL